MVHSRRSFVTTIGVTGATPLLAGLGSIAPTHADAAVPELVQRSELANAAFMRGDMTMYRSLVNLTDDFTLMSPFGGTPTRAADITEENWKNMARGFRNGRLRQELVHAYGSANMVTLAVIEHGHGEVHGLAAQDWQLRVTLVYRRDGGQWRLAHRHADPLVAPISLRQAATLAKGQAH
jgi:ketosteroid isomerase-like protein